MKIAAIKSKTTAVKLLMIVVVLSNKAAVPPIVGTTTLEATSCEYSTAGCDVKVLPGLISGTVLLASTVTK